MTAQATPTAAWRYRTVNSRTTSIQSRLRYRHNSPKSTDCQVRSASMSVRTFSLLSIGGDGLGLESWTRSSSDEAMAGDWAENRWFSVFSFQLRGHALKDEKHGIADSLPVQSIIAQGSSRVEESLGGRGCRDRSRGLSQFCNHSYRNDSMGSSRLALRAG